MPKAVGLNAKTRSTVPCTITAINRSTAFDNPFKYRSAFETTFGPSIHEIAVVSDPPFHNLRPAHRLFFPSARGFANGVSISILNRTALPARPKISRCLATSRRRTHSPLQRSMEIFVSGRVVLRYDATRIETIETAPVRIVTPSGTTVFSSLARERSRAGFEYREGSSELIGETSEWRLRLKSNRQKCCGSKRGLRRRWCFPSEYRRIEDFRVENVWN